MSNDSHQTRGASALAITAFLLVLTGAVGYFVLLFNGGGRYAAIRNDAVPNQILVVCGVLLGAWSSFQSVGRRAPKLLFAADTILAVAFAAVLYVVPIVPPARPPVIGSVAPHFSLTDHEGRTRTLTDFRGSPLLLVFYRGHW